MPETTMARVPVLLRAAHGQRVGTVEADGVRISVVLPPAAKSGQRRPGGSLEFEVDGQVGTLRLDDVVASVRRAMKAQEVS